MRLGDAIIRKNTHATESVFIQDWTWSFNNKAVRQIIYITVDGLSVYIYIYI